MRLASERALLPGKVMHARTQLDNAAAPASTYSAPANPRCTPAAHSGPDNEQLIAHSPPQAQRAGFAIRRVGWPVADRASTPPSESHPGQITAAPVALHSRHCCCYAYYCLLTSPKWLRRGPGDNADSPTSPHSARGRAKGESSQRAATQYRAWPTGRLPS